jgi:hypothetical protein
VDSGTRYTCDTFNPGPAEAWVTAAAFDPTCQLEGELDQNFFSYSHRVTNAQLVGLDTCLDGLSDTAREVSFCGSGVS